MLREGAPEAWTLGAPEAKKVQHKGLNPKTWSGGGGGGILVLVIVV